MPNSKAIHMPSFLLGMHAGVNRYSYKKGNKYYVGKPGKSLENAMEKLNRDFRTMRLEKIAEETLNRIENEDMQQGFFPPHN